MSTLGPRRTGTALVIGGLALAGAGLALVRVPSALRWDTSMAAAWLAMTCAIAVLELFPIRIRYRTETINMSVTDAVWAAGLLLVSPDVLVMSVAAGALLSQVIRRRPPRKIAFNVGQYLVSISAAVLVYSLLGGRGEITGAGWLPVIPAMTAFLLVNVMSVALVVGLAEGRGVARILRPAFGSNLLHFGCNTAIGVLAAIIWVHQPTAVLLLLAPITISYFAYRSLAKVALERDQMRDLYEAGRTLLGPIERSADFYPFLDLVRRMLDATLVEVVVADENELVIHDSAGRTSRRGAEADSAGRISLGSYLGVAADSRRDESAQVKIVAGREGARGLLVIHRTAQMTDSEHAVLDALASQLAVMLENHRLFAETLEQARLVDIISDSTDGVFVVSPDERILSWNPAMEDMSKVPAAEAIGRPVLELLSAGDGDGGGPVVLRSVSSDSEAFLQPDGGAPGTLASETGEAMVLGRGPGRHWVRYTKNVMRDKDGGVKAHVVVARDISAEMEAEQMKREFVATISHELRTPLTPLKGFLLTLMRGTGPISPEETNEYYGIMYDQVTRLERLIGDLLETSRLDTAGASVEIRHVELGAVVRQQIREFAQCQPGRPIKIMEPRRSVYVHADQIRVAQVLANLLSNAMKYSPPDSPITLALTSTGDEVVVAVRDEGEGIAADKLDRIFDRFYRIETGLTRRTGGTGLGLYITKRLVEAMDGRIWVDSTPSGGSTFFVALRRADGAASPVVATPVDRLLPA